MNYEGRPSRDDSAALNIDACQKQSLPRASGNDNSDSAKNRAGIYPQPAGPGQRLLSLRRCLPVKPGKHTGARALFKQAEKQVTCRALLNKIHIGCRVLRRVVSAHNEEVFVRHITLVFQ